MDFRHWMEMAYRVAGVSPDPSTQNGALLLDRGELIATGYNDFPPGVDSSHWHGPKAEKYARVLHAEVATIISAAREGRSPRGSTMVCPWAACSNCAKYLAASGIARLVRHPYLESGVTVNSHWFEEVQIGDEILKGAGVEIFEIPRVPTTVRLRRDGMSWPKEETGEIPQIGFLPE